MWVVEAVVRGRLPAKPEDKCAFILRPAEVRRSESAAASAECTADPGVGPPSKCRLDVGGVEGCASELGK